MKDYSYVFNAHPSYIEAVYKKYQTDPESVEDGWRSFFEGFEFASGANGHKEKILDSKSLNAKELGVLSLIIGYRNRGHLLSTTNPIRQRIDRKPHLDLQDYGLSEDDLLQNFHAGKEVGLENASLKQILDKLNQIYCGNIGFEYNHVDNIEKRTWLRQKIEQRDLSEGFGLTTEKKRRILNKLNGAVIFERFLHTKYVGQKRFSLEGGETTIAGLDAIINLASQGKVKEVVMGMAHRGRLNVLANIMGKTYEQIFNEFEGTAIPDLSFGDGDVKYHLGFSSQIEMDNGIMIDLKLAPNPSHLESVNPVLEGFTRAKADVLYNSQYDHILPILIHGDAALAGQGVVFETVQMSQLKGYYTGGTIHFVINNQIGFTTDFDDARSSTYSTAAASLVQAPVFHVNGDDPEAVVFACELAYEYRQKFNNDVFVDMVCYRRHGHNEGDDPKFTQPQMYDIIKKHKDPREIYNNILVGRGDVDEKMAKEMESNFWGILQDRLNLVKENPLPYTYQEPEQDWRKLKKTRDPKDFVVSPKTGITKKMANQVINHLMNLPEDFNPLSKVNRLQKSAAKILDRGKLDWALGELLAYGSILMEGKHVRISGQDVKRGTFSHRHAVFYDAKTNKEYNRFDGLAEDQGRFMIYNSLLSEFAVLGFEYGYSLASPNALVIWEAQFGDFYNGAQVIVDQYITAAESKWRRMSGLVMLLPHGYAGQGPEHSSARLERFLQSAAEYNVSVVNITTPANFFHVLRRQLARPFRKPIFVMSPKSLLRHPECISDLKEFIGNKNFQEIIEDPIDSISNIKRVLFCSGKLYYDLKAYKDSHKRDDVNIIRIEQLYPYPKIQLDKLFAKYSHADKFWVQEEPGNMGAWNYLLHFWRKEDIEFISRRPSASPATGFKKIHEEQQNAIVEQAFNQKLSQVN
jgi:2-oxoglutarate dehydrogenase E1 component